MGFAVGYRNLADAAELTALATVVSGFPLANLKTRQVGEFCRFETEPSVVAEWDDEQTISVIGFAGCNMSPGQPLASITADRWDSGTSDWVQIADASFADASLVDTGGYLFAVLSTPVVTSKIRITAAWEPPADVDTFDAGRLWVSDCIWIPEGADGDWERMFTDSGVVDISRGEQAYEVVGVRCAAMTLKHSALPTLIAWGFDEDATEATAIPSFNDMQFAAGTTGEIVVFPKTKTPLWIRRTMIYGRVTGEWGIRHVAGPLWGVSIPFKQER